MTRRVNPVMRETLSASSTELPHSRLWQSGVVAR